MQTDSEEFGKPKQYVADANRVVPSYTREIPQTKYSATLGFYYEQKRIADSKSLEQNSSGTTAQKNLSSYELI